MLFGNSRLLLLCLVALLGGAGLAHWQSNRAPELVVANATVLTAPRALPEFELRSHTNQPFTVENLVGHWSVVFFGFTHCPDVCPTTMSMLAQTRKVLQTSQDDLQVIMISVDPERDTVETLVVANKSRALRAKWRLHISVSTRVTAITRLTIPLRCS